MFPELEMLCISAMRRGAVREFPEQEQSAVSCQMSPENYSPDAMHAE
jgi:hypothetical protein